MNELTPTAALALRLYVATRSAGVVGLHRLRTDERGEGVISAAIAVLVMAFLGILMWKGFQGIFETVRGKAETQVGNIGEGGS